MSLKDEHFIPRLELRYCLIKKSAAAHYRYDVTRISASVAFLYFLAV